MVVTLRRARAAVERAATMSAVADWKLAAMSATS
jgi:hypothetical protein